MNRLKGFCLLFLKAWVFYLVGFAVRFFVVILGVGIFILSAELLQLKPNFKAFLIINRRVILKACPRIEFQFATSNPDFFLLFTQIKQQYLGHEFPRFSTSILSSSTDIYPPYIVVQTWATQII